jgi:hypothetical protein
MHHSHKVLYLRSASPHRPPPSLTIHIGLEDVARVHIVAGTDLDAARLVGWLDSSGLAERLPEIVTEAVERLRPGGENEAA